jgi:hypothetical protein
MAWMLKIQEQRRRILLLGRQLAPYRIEKHMERLAQGYLRALGEDDPERSQPIWALLRGTEEELCQEFDRFAAEFARLPEAETRVSKLPVDVPLATRLLPAMTFDMRQALMVHARGIRRAVETAGQPSPKQAAYTLSAELFLMQHTCHWFCKSRTVASARMLARHKTPYEQLLASVSSQTREAYLALVERS